MSRPALFLVAALALLPGRARASDLLADSAQLQAEIEDRVRQVLVHRLDGDATALAADVAALETRDDARRASGLPRSGLTDDVRYLAAGLAESRDAQRDALHHVLDEHPDPVIRKLAEHSLEADDAAAADRLLSDDRHNRRAAVVNDFVRPLGIFSGAAAFAAINPFLLAGSAVESVATTAVNLWNYNRLSTPEREALAHYRTLVAKVPRTHDAPEIAHAIRKLGTKRAESLCVDTVALGKKALKADDLDHAIFYLRQADGMEHCETKAKRPLADAEEAFARRAAREEAARWPVDDPPQPKPAEAADYQAMLFATAMGDPGAMIESASRFAQRHDDGHFAPGARYVVAVARDLAGHHDEARTALAELAHDEKKTDAGRHAAALLASADFSRLEALDDAERHHTRDTLKYVFLGGQLDGRTAIHTASSFGAQGVQAAQSFGMINVIGMLTRAWTAWRHDPVSNQTIIDRGEEFLTRSPHSAEAPAVHARLAEAYARAGSYDRALMHYHETPDPSPAHIAKLEGKMADQLLDEAERNGGNPVLLQGIVTHFAETKAADKARKRLKDRPGSGETVVERQVLLANPALLGPDALDLDPTLLDGERKNGELADGGITLAPEGELRLTLYNTEQAGQHFETRTLAPEAYARARAAVQEVLYDRLLTADRLDPETGRYERYIPFYVQGSFGESGVSVAPGVKLRRYNSEDKDLYE
jgi:hypothetical protein